jgi:heme-degrading monooxygenase HmoA
MMIRSWRAKATLTQAQAYARHLSEHVVPALERIEGYCGATLLRQDRGDSVELVVLTRWASMAAIRRFAGENPQVAVVEPAAQAILSEYERTVTHYEVVLDAVPTTGS